MTPNAFELPPDDAHDRRLIGHVHPPDWVNPRPAERYHLVVIGGGTAGLVCAAAAAGLGARVALIERSLLGGDCLNMGCVPSKAVLRASRAWHAARTAAAEFGAPPIAGDGDFAAAMARMRRIRADIAAHDSAARLRSLGVDVFIGEGRFVDGETVAVAGSELRFWRAVIATGARATALPIPGLAAAGFLTNETVFALTELPRRLAVIGAGPIGCELAQAFARFGSAVTVFDIASEVLVREDPDAAALIRTALERDGVRFELGVQIEEVVGAGSGRTLRLEREGSRFELGCDQLLLAVGRSPNVEGLELGNANVRHNKFGVEVDDHLRTSNPAVYACGDIASRYKFTHVADAEARIVIQNALFFGRKRASQLVVPWCTYTSPEIAHVGLYARDAEEQDIAIDTVTLPLSEVDRALLDGQADGFLRLHLARGRDQILGATLVADHAGDLLSELTVAMTAGVGLGKLSRAIHPYPTQAEVIKKAADQYQRGRLTPTVLRVLRYWFDFFR